MKNNLTWLTSCGQLEQFLSLVFDGKTGIADKIFLDQRPISKIRMPCYQFLAILCLPKMVLKNFKLCQYYRFCLACSLGKAKVEI